VFDSGQDVLARAVRSSVHRILDMLEGAEQMIARIEQLNRGRQVQGNRVGLIVELFGKFVNRFLGCYADIRMVFQSARYGRR